MEERVMSPQYFRIALDIARRIAKGELEEGRKIYGRSQMAAEYGVSAETIRRALKLLSDMEVVTIKPKSCVIIASAEGAGRYVNRFGTGSNVRELRAGLRGLLSQHAELGRRISEAVTELTRIDESLTGSDPFQNYEAQLPEASRAVGKNLGELSFWQATGATVIAIRRQGAIILSPGPYAQLQERDILVFVGNSEAVQAVRRLLSEVES